MSFLSYSRIVRSLLASHRGRVAGEDKKELSRRHLASQRAYWLVIGDELRERIRKSYLAGILRVNELEDKKELSRRHLASQRATLSSLLQGRCSDYNILFVYKLSTRGSSIKFLLTCPFTGRSFPPELFPFDPLPHFEALLAPFTSLLYHLHRQLERRDGTNPETRDGSNLLLARVSLHRFIHALKT